VTRRFARGDEDWEIRQDAERLLLVADGKESTRKFVSAAHAATQHDKLIAEKLAAGWEELAPGAKRPRREKAGEPREPMLEAAVLANRYDRDARSVYGDWLHAREHPRGALVAMQLGERDDDTVDRHLMRYKAELLGDLARHVLVDGTAPFSWFGGFIHSVELLPEHDVSPQQLLREIVGHPSGRFLAEATAVATDRRHVTGVLGALKKHPLLELEIVTDVSLRDELALLPSLTTLRRFSLSAVASAQEERRELQTGGEVLRAISAISPSIRDLVIRLDGRVADPTALAPLFQRADLQLHAFALRAPTVLTASLDLLPQAPWAATLEVLDAGLIRADPLWEMVLARPERFPALHEVRVSTKLVRKRLLEELGARYRVTHIQDHAMGLFEDAVGEEHFYSPVRE
jgi:uncharacterized protein (TIGR02996 family)